jgi:hypothetical protein
MLATAVDVQSAIVLREIICVKDVDCKAGVNRAMFSVEAWEIFVGLRQEAERA